MKNNDPYNLKNIYNKILEYHNENEAIGDLRPSNILIGPDNSIEFIKLSTSKEKQEAKQKDILKFFVLAIGYYTNNIEQLEDLLQENSNITDEDVKNSYRGHTKIYKEIRNIVEDHQNSINNAPSKDSNSNNKGRSYTYNDGHHKNTENNPNAFISMVLFPFITLYLFLILALLYWMIVI